MCIAQIDHLLLSSVFIFKTAFILWLGLKCAFGTLRPLSFLPPRILMMSLAIRRQRCTPQNQVSGAFCHHNRRRVQVTISDGGENRRIYNPQTTNAVHLCLWVYHRKFVRPHFA